MKFKVYDDPAQYWALAEDWGRILEKLGNPSVFLTPQWVGLSYEYFGAEAESFLVTAWDDGELLGVFPFSLRGNAVRFSTDAALTEHADVVVHPGRRREVISQLGPFLRAYFEAEFPLELGNIKESSPNLLPLLETLGASKVASASYYSVNLPKDVRGLDYGLIKPQDLKLLNRRADRMLRAGAVEVEALSEPLEIAENLDDLLWMFISGGAEAHRFLTPEREAFLREVLPLLAKLGLARLFYLKLDGVRVAAHLLFQADGSALVYMSGESGEALELSPGVLLLKAILEHLVEEGQASTVEFPRGREPYKRLFGAKEACLCKLVRGEAEPSDERRPETNLNW